ncbi:amidohydrolase family protein [Conexibacter sp. DBS9H8]|uniref:amidohydrolase family protein n=1 Tax=Conexibacter sp. DBS9H8 TaxID=2937801 RepID=UPI00200CCE43|nr:amidohydrolase family protein [Conexibacter sp. DBS9H8]
MALTELLARWRASIREQVPGLEIFDAHTHVGCHDPDGFTQSFRELVDRLASAEACGCFVFPFHEPDGYPHPNDTVRAEAEAHRCEHPDGPAIVPFCRVNPREGAVAEAQRSLDLGARGIKLHPRAEAFTLDHPAVADLFALAAERTVPILVHSGRGIEAPGAHIVRLAERYPGARVILAHAGATDLSWLWRAAPAVPNLLFDSAWWMPADLTALFCLIPPGQILFASDAPYGDPLVTAICQARIAQQAGLSADQIRLIFAGQSRAVAAGAPLICAGPAVGERESAPHVLLNRVAEFIQMATMLWIRGGDGAESLALARQACQVPEEHDDAPLFAALLDLLDAHTAMHGADPEDRRHLSVLMLAGAVARTPAVPLPG